MIAFSSPALAEPFIVVAGPAAGRHAETVSAMMEGARRGAGGRAVRLTTVDDGCDAGRAEAAARMTANEKPDLVIGHPCPAAAIAAAKVYASTGILFVALGVRHPDLTDKRAGPTIFRLAGRDDRQGRAAAEELLALAPTSRIAIVQDRTAYARGLTAAITAELAARKAPAPAIVAIVAGRRDYDVDLQKLKAAPPEAIFFAGYPSEAAVVLRGLRKSGIAASLVASDANATDAFGAVVAPLDASGPAVKVMVRAPQSGGMDAADLSLAAERAVAVWRTVAGAGPGEIAARLSTNTGGVEDTVRFDAQGDALLPSFAAVPLISGRWAGSINAGP